jgi:hypothetical protein
VLFADVKGSLELLADLDPEEAIDGVSDAEDALALVEGIAGARYCQFEGKGHLPIFTAPREFCEILRQFVRTGAVPAGGE